MGEVRGVVVRKRTSVLLSCGERNKSSVYIFAFCVARSLRSRGASLFLDAQWQAKRGKRNAPMREGRLKSEACCVQQVDEQADGEGTVSSILPGLDDETASRCIAFASRSTYGALSLTQKRLRELVQSGFIYELRRRLGILEQWVYMYATGDSGWKAFDPKRGKWMRLPPCETDYVFIMTDKESLSAGTHLLWMGVEISDHIIHRYKLTTNSWDRAPLMNQRRCLFASASCNEFAFVAGGYYGGHALKSAERYDSLQGAWERLPDMNIARQKSSGCFLDGKFYVIGGRDSDYEGVTSAEEYDHVRKRWKLIPDMLPAPAGRESAQSSPPLIAVMNNDLYWIDSSINVLKCYHRPSNSWSTLGPVPVRADYNNGWGLAFKSLGDELYVIGGYRGSYGEGMAMFSWKPKAREGNTLEWTMVNSMFAGTGNFLSNCAVMSC